jgi:DNA-directed RNA polymerase specialized sigma subunit
MQLDDFQLVFNLQKKVDTDNCLQELVNRHSGIFYDIINKFVPSNSDICSRKDLFDDRELHIYNTALKFDSSKGTKFSTFLGNETKWLCLNSYNKAKRKYCENKTPEELDFIDKFENNNTIDKNLINEIYFIINKHPDPRVSRIFKMRYKDGHNYKLLPWKNIAPKVKLSIQGCINIHDNVVMELKKKLLKKELK